MGKRMTTRQIRELVDIDRARGGIRAEVQELISQLTSGGASRKSKPKKPKPADPREAQAKVLWDKNFGHELGHDSFDAYLATIPEVPENLLAEDERFPELALVDTRLGLVKTCELLGVDYSGNDQTHEDFDPNKAKTEKVYWIRCQDGLKNHGKSVAVCRNQFADAGDEIGLTAHEGLALFAQNPRGLKNRAMDLPGSVRCECRGYAAYLDWFDERPELYWRWGVRVHPYYGSGSRRE